MFREYSRCLGLLLCVFFALAGCRASKQTAETKPATFPLRVQTATGWVTFEVELAVTNEERQKGLMFRTEMPAGRGMLFVFSDDSKRSFYMKNTYISLDMLFIDGTRKVAGIVHQATPHTLDSRGVEKPSRYVLEINGGLAKKHGITAGAQVDFSKIPIE